MCHVLPRRLLMVPLVVLVIGPGCSQTPHRAPTCTNFRLTELVVSPPSATAPTVVDAGPPPVVHQVSGR